MRLPDADLAVVDREKVVDYLMEPTHPDNGGLPNDAIVLADGIVSTGDGAGQVEFNLGSPVVMGAGEKFWVIVRGDAGCCDGEDFNLEVDQTTPPVQSFRNACDGLVNLSCDAGCAGSGACFGVWAGIENPNVCGSSECTGDEGDLPQTVRIPKRQHTHSGKPLGTVDRS